MNVHLVGNDDDGLKFSQFEMNDEVTYELKRKENIARNAKVLQDIGIDSPESIVSHSIRSPESRRRPPKSKRKLEDSFEDVSPRTALGENVSPRTRSRNRSLAAAAPEAAAHHEQQRTSSSRASGAAVPQAQQRIRNGSALGAAEHQAQHETSFAVGQTVWARNPRKYGMSWWPATVSSIDPLVLEWVDGSVDKLYSPLDFQDVQLRLVCRCGNCTATALEDDEALDLHRKIVAACINSANLQEIQSLVNR